MNDTPFQAQDEFAKEAVTAIGSVTPRARPEQRHSLVLLNHDAVHGPELEPNAGGGFNGHPKVHPNIPRIFRFDDSPPEATGLAMDVFARGMVLMSSQFLGTALLDLAKEEAYEKCMSTFGQDDDFDGDPESYCVSEARVYGMKPSSLLSNIAIVGGLSSAILLPLAGAVVDHTPHRRLVGVVSGAGLAVVKGAEAIIFPNTWAIVALLQIVSALLYHFHLCATLAYTSELTSEPADQTKYNAHFAIVLFTSTLLFLVEVMVAARILGSDDVGTARISQIITFLASSVLFGYAWGFLFRERPALSEVPGDSTLLKCGFKKIISTTKQIWSDRPALKWFMISVVLGEAGMGALVTLAVTFMKYFLDMNSGQIGLSFLTILLGGIPGTKTGELIALRFNPLVSAKCCLCSFLISTVVSAFVLSGPEDHAKIYPITFFWGACLGWLHPMNTAIFCTIIPKGQESELMGMFIFCGSVLSWLPSLLFTVLNEVGVAMNIGLASMSVFFAGGLSALFLIGRYDHAVIYAKCGSQTSQFEMREVDESPGNRSVKSSLPVEALPPLS